jgi:hypothetical protein
VRDDVNCKSNLAASFYNQPVFMDSLDQQSEYDRWLEKIFRRSKKKAKRIAASQEE